MSFDRAMLGRTGVEVCRLGVASSYGAPASVVERAFDHGVNYFYWGSLRRSRFGDGLRALASQRDRLLLVTQSYSRMASLIGPSLERALRTLRFDYTDALLLGLWNGMPPPRILDACLKLRERGLVRYLAVSTHNRPLIAQLATDPRFDIFHVRYNAVHRGAEHEVFAQLPEQNPPGIVSFTATSWRQLLGHKRIPKNEKIPTATDCYRFVLTEAAVNICMTGPADDKQFEQALEALRRGPMADEDLQRMRRIGDAIYGRVGQDSSPAAGLQTRPRRGAAG
ncbi:MAG TPA: aldo/keto reductase [Bryobacteraceae bacterium]|jgi:aryl-alcohol dehydrogenase-like predicted oxidoreductase|nr:aldo/keto reductase [Bryobacteraceae bacterium]